MKVIARFSAAWLTLLLMSCSGAVWPSYAMEISLAGTNSAPGDVDETVRNFVIPRGYRQEDKNGYDQINGTLTSVNYVKGEGIVLTVALDRIDAVLIRLSYSPENLRDEARAEFEALTSVLMTRWSAIQIVP